MSESNDQPDRLVQVAVAPNEIIAALWKGWLAEEGIESLVKAAGPGLAYFTNFANQHLIFVLEKDADHAREILSESADAGEVSEADDLA